MKSLSILIAGLSAFASANLFIDRRAPSGCIADNCLRALTVTDSNLKASRPVMAASDCTALMIQTSTVTVSPTSTAYQTISTVTSTTLTSFVTNSATITITSLISSTITVPLPEIADPPARKRDLQSIPSYLSACSNLARLSSACSCAGYTTSTVTKTATLPAFALTISTSTTSVNTIISTSTTTKSTSTTTQATAVVTATAICVPAGKIAIAPVGSICGTQGNINLDNQNSGLFFSGPIDSISCHVKCLQEPTCKSFIALSSTDYCMLFTYPAAQAMIPQQVGYPFYDVGCSQYRPTC